MDSRWIRAPPRLLGSGRRVIPRMCDLQISVRPLVQNLFPQKGTAGHVVVARVFCCAVRWRAALPSPSSGAPGGPATAVPPTAGRRASRSHNCAPARRGRTVGQLVHQMPYDRPRPPVRRLLRTPPREGRSAGNGDFDMFSTSTRTRTPAPGARSSVCRRAGTRTRGCPAAATSVSASRSRRRTTDGADHRAQRRVQGGARGQRHRAPGGALGRRVPGLGGRHGAWCG
jgi:hypothetical protein